MTTIDFDKKVKCGNEFVSVRIIENCENLKVGNIYLTSHADANGRLAFCQIEDIGIKAADKTGCKIGDYVMIDRLSTFAHTAPIACLKYDSVICMANENNTEHYPLKDMLFVQPDDKDDIVNLKGIFVANPVDRINLGTIIKTNFEKNEEYPFENGQRVLLTKGADVIQFSQKTIYVYKKDMIVCSIVE